MININVFKDELVAILDKIDGQVDAIKVDLEQNKKPLHLFNKGTNLPGVYAIFIKPKSSVTLKKLEKAWNLISIIKFPKVVKYRFNESVKNNPEYYTFYIGKSEKVDTRLNEHITHTSKITTYGLKLNDRVDFLNDNELFYAKYEMDELIGLDPSIIQFVITRIELKLRGKMNPWIGKQ